MDEQGKHNEAKMDGGKANLNGGKNSMKRQWVWHRRATGKRSLQNKHCRQTQPADSPPGTGLNTNGQQLAGLAANNSRR